MGSADQNSDGSMNVQHVNKKCSDELLRKFSDSDDEEDRKLELVIRATKRRKRSSRQRVGPIEAGESCESPTNCNSLVERRSLLPVAARTRKSVLLRRLGIGRSFTQLRARELRNRSLLGTIEKTWRKTVEGASRVFMEKHYHRHKRLINDSVV
ncbi:uncharacterized protein LOC116207826 [Punica granatum]|uniref:Uncharacterized protein n=2 Tax=Punica granatum TaxID=22663 RepID=A0A218XBQ6_PUNGR|nr:uncharacterized protein LOC116207826 [Punica granatum]OWM82655.1 hypothetical protein CDL15_Pgr002230 [Punica granatum]PKI54181.1 hypothetical protein CRG98_025414 [Punica granatum]